MTLPTESTTPGADFLRATRPDLDVTLPSLSALLGSEEGRRVAALVVERSYAPGELLCNLDQLPEGLFIVATGQVSTLVRAHVRPLLPVEVQGPGAAFGAFALAGDTSTAVRARAITAVTARLLPRAAFGDLAAWPGLARVVSDVRRLEEGKRRFAHAMRAIGPFAAIGVRYLVQLLSSAQLGEWSPETAGPGETGRQLVAEGAAGTGFYFLLEGRLAQARTINGAGDSMLVGVLSPNSVFGILPVVMGLPEPFTVTAKEAARWIFVPRDAYLRILESSPALQRALNASIVHHAATETGHAATQLAEARDSLPPILQHHTQAVLLQSDVPGAPLSALAELLAGALAVDHGDSVLLLRLVPPAPGERWDDQASPEPLRDGVLQLRVPVADDADVASLLLARIEAARHHHDHVFLDAGGRSPAFVARLAPAVGRVLFLSPSPLSSAPIPELRRLPILNAALLGQRRPPSAWRAYPYATVRVRLDLDRIEALRPEARASAALPPALRATLSRWARAISERQVGVALGGGGSWGYVHVAVLKALVDAGIPIDMVSGTSFGSLVAAFYCARGADAIPMLLDPRIERRMNSLTLRNFISSNALADFIDEMLGGVRLEDLEVPCYPVATDVSDGTEHVPSVGTVGQGARASSAFPMVFTPFTSAGGLRCVDGGFINNVPASVLVPEGADLIIASNCISSPLGWSDRPLLPGAFGRKLHEFNPLARALDVLRASWVLFHTNGDRECELADATFVSSSPAGSPMDFAGGPEIVEKTMPQTRELLVQVQRLWRATSTGDTL